MTGKLLKNVMLHRSLLIGGLLSFLLVGASVVSLFWTPFSPTAIDIVNKLQGPSAKHWLGTDHLGRDVFSMLLSGSQISIIVGFLAVSLGLCVGVALGALASAYRGWLEELIMRMSDFSIAFPIIITAVLLTAILGPGTVNSIIAIGIFNIPIFARITRGAANAVWAREYVLAAQTCGKGRLRITIEHVLPNISGALIVQATILFAVAILAEAALSFLGLGTQPPEPSWGKMLNNAQTFVGLAPHLAIFPGLAIALSVLGLNLIGDGLRDVLDPKLARAR
ncbi:ABC transporter permease [Pseudaminobacter sp. NGMCC 1.201702]|uniref:ABC transporter permease n=1 Tax=Pseudaminobacter sp. NGMCC 1.201702 TaxID=3391825 RepID=UPI0039F1440E